MPDIKSCGFLIYKSDPNPSILLMRHPARWDLPKGHVDPGESDMECALRELVEETGIKESDIEIDEHFRFDHDYVVRPKRFGRKPKDKRLTIFLAQLVNEVEIVVSEHEDYEWLEWNPPHKIQKKTIDPLLEMLAEYWG